MWCDRNIDTHAGVNTGPSDEPLITCPLWEPPIPFTLSEQDLVHLLILGSTGSGKTTLVLGMLQQLIRQRMGLLILDAKQDGLTDLISEMATAAGREKDLAILGPSGTHTLDLLGSLRSYEDVETLTQWLLLATERMGGENAFWQTSTSAMISAALTLLTSRHRRVSFAEAVEFMRNWFVRMEGASASKHVAELLEHAKRQAAKPKVSTQLLGALDQVEVWKQLDWRTRSNLQACLLNVLRPLCSSAAARSFDAGDRLVFHPAQVATEGKLCVVSVNALTHPDLAKLLMRIARRQFFDAVQARSSIRPRLDSGLVADEFALIVQPEDADQLATLRSKGCFVLAAAQGLSGIEDKIGVRTRRSVLLNFNTIIFMRTREQEAGEFATLSLGMREQFPPKRSEEWADANLAAPPHQLPRERHVPICPPGALGRLQPHQAYVVKADGSRSSFPVWFVPWFDSAGPKTNPPQKDTRNSVFDAGHVYRLMERLGMPTLISQEILEAAFSIDAGVHDRALNQAREFFRNKAAMIPEGLESLPAAWLAGLPAILWSTRKPHWSKLPYMIRHVASVDGVLLLDFAQEDQHRSSRVTVWDRIRAVVNRCLYPSRWRPLLQRHQAQLSVGWSHIRPSPSEADSTFS